MENPTIANNSMDARDNARVWIVQGFLAIAFGIAGIMKMTLSMETLTDMLTWPGSVAKPLVRLIGAAEFLGALGLVVPMLTGIKPWLTSLAAFGLMALMIGALGYHLMLFQGMMLLPSLLLGSMAAYVGVRRMS